ncbi:hypothetical protein [Nonomuraea jiangxiensis]|uniref:Uncharacterized protein n=1 Tax=Nonomuraea jiangxiensis TaxID=633440 RepID=A0A1G7Y9N9_9ACTN|nr:hypothetical protein [Nonomuraea jiangxiensis]SDG93097.1 hypothetical protein SAMN05421869_10149 [Nonomuraea jiangxiensis]
MIGAIVSGVNVRPFPNPGRPRLLGTWMAPVMKWGLVPWANARALNVPAEDVPAIRTPPGTPARARSWPWRPELFTAMIWDRISGGPLPGELVPA